MRSTRHPPAALLAVLLSLGSSSALARGHDPSSATPPTSDATLPRYDEAAELEHAAPWLREVPDDGRGLLAAGGLISAGGTILLISGAVLVADGNTEPPIYAPMLVLGFVAPAVGGVLLGVGHYRHRSYREWAAGQTDPIPPQGNALFASGGVLLAAGTFGAAIGGVFSIDILDPPPGAPALLGLGLGSLAVGATLLVFGARRNKRYRAWRRDTSSLARVRLAPSLSPTRGGVRLGLTGRF